MDLDVRALERLAALELDPEERERLRGDLQRILAHVDRMAAVDVEGIEPLEAGPGIVPTLREDVPRASLPLEEALRGAPAVRDGHFAVPSVLPPDQP